MRLQLSVAKDGNVTQVSALGGNPVLIVAAEDAARHWRYEPAAGESTEVVEFHFHPLQQDALR